MAKEVVWDEKALLYLEQALDWISQESFVQADNVENAIQEGISKVTEYPESYPLDKFKRNNTGKYRAFETHNYRISYTYNDDQILILRVRHVKQSPLYF